MERYESGLIDLLGKQAYRKVPWVRIPPSPPMFEHRSKTVLPRLHFFKRLVWHGFFAFLLIALSLFFGTFAYHQLENMPWIDALLNASMILGGMGPVSALQTSGGKMFASFYALYSGILFLVMAAIIFAPLVHRLLHTFHVDSDEKGE